MKRQSMIFMLLLLQVLFICIGCGSSDKSAAFESPAAAAEEAAAVTEEAAVEEAAPAEAPLTEEAAVPENAVPEVVEDAIGVFEGLEDNHTAIFSFDGAETAFFFEDPAVQNVLYEAVLGSTYTLSYEYNDSFGYIIFQISEH